MLVGFSVGNFRSFKDVQSFSMNASKVTRHDDHVVKTDNARLLRSAIVMGANAGGKSNLVKAVDFSLDIIRFGLDVVDLEKQYFRIDPAMIDQPGVFSYNIIVGDTEYSYGFSISYRTKEIIGEWLYQVDRKGGDTCLFSRETEDGETDIQTEFVGDPAFNVLFDPFQGETPDALRKVTLLNDIANRTKNPEGLINDIKKVYNWFNKFVVIFPHSKYNKLGSDVGNKVTRDYLENRISGFDTGIDHIVSTKAQMDLDGLFAMMDDDEVRRVKVRISRQIDAGPVVLNINSNLFVVKRDENGNIVYDKVVFDHGNPNDMFDFDDESDGTRRLFDLIPIFLEAKRMEGCVFFVDEIDRSLHSKLTKRFFELVFSFDKSIPLQIISTTHDSNLLDLDQFRQDEIWFVERNKDHSTSLFSLSKFKERFDKRIDKEYLQGKYGAIPEFDEELLAWEDMDDSQ